MSVDKEISIATVKNELEKCDAIGEEFGWKFSDIDEENLSFTVRMVSPIKGDEFIVKVVFDNYPQIPPLIEFIHPETGEEGARDAYPKTNDSFFHEKLPCLCNPCSRKSYKQFNRGAPHGDWKPDGWKTNKDTGNLTSMNRILAAIDTRIRSKKYFEGRMQ